MSLGRIRIRCYHILISEGVLAVATPIPFALTKKNSAKASTKPGATSCYVVLRGATSCYVVLLLYSRGGPRPLRDCYTSEERNTLSVRHAFAMGRVQMLDIRKVLFVAG